MNFLKSSSVVTTGSIITPLMMRRMSSSAMMLLGLTMARVSRLLAKATGMTRCCTIMVCGSSESTRGSKFILLRLMNSMPTCWLAASTRSARMVVSARPILGYCSSRS